MGNSIQATSSKNFENTCREDDGCRKYEGTNVKSTDNEFLFAVSMTFLSDEGPLLKTFDNYSHISAVLKPF